MDEPDPSQLLSDVLFRKGWASVLPPGALDILEVLLDASPPVHDAIDARLRTFTRRRDGLDSPAWDEDEPWFEEGGPGSDVRDVPLSYEGVPGPGKRGLSARRAEAFDRQLRVRGLPPGRTLEAVLDLLVVCDVVMISPRGQYAINPLAPVAAPVL